MHYISEFLRQATQEIYISMACLSVVPQEGDDLILWPLRPKGVTSSVQFTGGFTAALYMSYDEELAKNVTFTILGTMPKSADPADVGDVLGELTNMIGGSFKARMAGKGFTGSISAPIVQPSESVVLPPWGGGVALFNRMQIPVATGHLEIRCFAKL